MHPKVFFSNQVEILYRNLKASLFSSSTTPFTQRLIVVPSPAMKLWLAKSLASDPDIQIAMGVKIVTLKSATREVINTLAKSPATFPKPLSNLELSLKIEVELRKIMYQEDVDLEIWEPIFAYIKEKKTGKKLTQLASELATLFQDYQTYGMEMLKEWKAPDYPPHWQQQLWLKVAGEVFPETFEWKPLPYQVHLFAMSYVPQQLHRLFENLSTAFPVYFYLLSPCKMLWSDLLSDRETQRLLAYWEKKGVPDANQQALEELLFDKNPLLANFGKLGREMALQTENTRGIIEEQYAAPESILSHPLYASFVDDEVHPQDFPKEISRLHCLQADLLFLRDGREMPLRLDDGSVQLHQAATPLREVEAIHDQILALINQHNHSDNPLLPEEVIVMAPEISVYEPYIQAVFNDGTSPLDVQVIESQGLKGSPLAQGILLLFKLAEGRWEVSTLFDLLALPIFTEKQGFSEGDISRIKHWTEVAGIRWGRDAHHRKKVLEREYPNIKKINTPFAGTWERGIDRLLIGLTTFSEEGLDHISSTEALLFGRWLQLLKGLEEDLAPLAGETKLSLEDWSSYLMCLIETYFSIGSANEETLFSFIRGLNQLSSLKGKTFYFSVLKHHLEGEIAKCRTTYRESHFHAVRFCSLLPMRALPARVVILMGMSEEAFPRKSHQIFLNALKKERPHVFVPTQSDFDRYLFLETILSARETLILSHSSETPSLLVQELFDYLDKSYPVPQDKFKHPFHSYDSRLFMENSPIRSYSKEAYKTAKALAAFGEKQSPHAFVSTFFRGEIPQKLSVSSIPIRELSLLARKPVDFYLKHALQMFLREEESDEMIDEEQFLLNLLDQAILKRESISKPVEEILSYAEKTDKLPEGPFQHYSIGKLTEECFAIQEFLNSLDVSFDEIFSLEFSSRHYSPFCDGKGGWKFPSFRRNVGDYSVEITGVLPEVSPKGLLFYGSDSKVDLVKVWPLYVLYCAAVDHYNLPFAKDVLCLKSKKIKTSFLKEPQESLEKFLHYYFMAHSELSPLIPEWVPTILEGDVEQMETTMKQSLSARNTFFYQNAVKWVIGGDGSFDGKALIKNWQGVAQELFDPGL